MARIPRSPIARTAIAVAVVARARDFSLTAHFSLRGGGEQGRDGGTFAAPAEGSYRFWADVTTGRHSKPGGPITRCGVSARSFTPSGD